MRGLGWIVGMVLCACGPLVHDGPSEGSAGARGSSSDADASASEGADESGTGDPFPPGSTCRAQCTNAFDCCLAYGGDETCMGQLGTYPWNFECIAGACTNDGCTSDEDCTFGGVLQGWSCVEQAGTSACQPGCTSDADCDTQGLPGWTCDGAQHCLPPPCTNDETCPAGSFCDDTAGRCRFGCTDDDGCSGFGLCDESTGSCTCSAQGHCPVDFACAPP